MPNIRISRNLGQQKRLFYSSLLKGICSTLIIVNSKAVKSGIEVRVDDCPAEFLVASSYVGGVMG